MINIQTINDYIKNLIDANTMSDMAINGIQVENSGEITGITFAVDASIESINETIKNKSNLLIVHHGFLWGKEQAVTGIYKKRLELLIKNNIGLIAYHLPLDAHAQVGNNAVILKKLDIESFIPFAECKSTQIGCIGSVKTAFTIKNILDKLGLKDNYKYLDFGTKDIKKIGVVSGGGTSWLQEAIQNGVELFITGDSSHQDYHVIKEHGINVLFAGHYFTETFGINALKDVIFKDFNISIKFADIPTGM